MRYRAGRGGPEGKKESEKEQESNSAFIRERERELALRKIVQC